MKLPSVGPRPAASAERKAAGRARTTTARTTTTMRKAARTTTEPDARRGRYRSQPQRLPEAGGNPLARAAGRLFSGSPLEAGEGRPDSVPASEPTLSPAALFGPSEPFLRTLPGGLRTCYRPLPLWARALTLLVPAWGAISRAALAPGSFPGPLFGWIRGAAAFLVRSLLWVAFARVALQETIFRGKVAPSRVTTGHLRENGWLPTTLSRYEPVEVDPPSGSAGSSGPRVPLGVHYLRYSNSGIDKADNREKESTGRPPLRFGAMYFQHGFGASSLSWLPVLPSLSDRLGARVALGHDAVGFGFTDRPKDPFWYTAGQSSRIARAVLAKETQGTVEPKEPVCLVGHSMGSLSVLRLALLLPEETPKLVVLSSPALGLLKRRAEPKTPPAARSILRAIGAGLAKKMLLPPSRYLLRRAIGAEGAWKKGLEAAWGDPSALKEDSDVLRYSWPSIGAGWEDGILRFVRAQALPAEDDLEDDAVLLEKVLELPSTRVLVVLGERDRVVQGSALRAFLESVEKAPRAQARFSPVVVELDRLGHNAFEEDREVFCDLLERLVEDHWDGVVADDD
ncbi:unnamed protein product [Pseudo-nitzschia multistriata]|uniref:AB hydrolase-1 domain-containing protein n=1 Tax=Pseudo-nitzschia multistriata TaxID=183589 RepID=A0A448ZR82_9STRA|nr:unnamed protein product [Pseudo-nitzschia multistriata]